MKLTPNSFFEGKFKEINLNNFYIKHKHTYNNLIKNMSKTKAFSHLLWFECLDFRTFGGYGENRKEMWRGTYIEETKKYYHLGIDINMPKNTPIKVPFSCYIKQIFFDTDMDIGWGTRIIIESINNDRYYLVLGHLNHKIIYPSVYRNGKGILGYVGNYPENGNVFPHLHIQAIKKENIKNFDGYGFKKDLKDNPNPFEIEW